jgi:hypothetical protein
VSNKNSSFENYINTINESLAEYNIQLASMELLGVDGEPGRTVEFNINGKNDGIGDWVPNDPRNWFPTNPFPSPWNEGILPYWVDGTELGTTSGMTDAETLNAINSAMNTWSNIGCSGGLQVTSFGVTNVNGPFNDIGLMQWLRGMGGKPWLVPGVIAHAGILPLAFFDALSGGNGANILGVTFVWWYTSGGEFTDIDQNGKRDTAYIEIYYNDHAPYQDAPDDVPGNGIVDFESVALHEAGHALALPHYGKAFTTNANDQIHYAPYALMNPSYSIGIRDLTGTDVARHCDKWAQWPAE